MPRLLPSVENDVPIVTPGRPPAHRCCRASAADAAQDFGSFADAPRHRPPDHHLMHPTKRSSGMSNDDLERRVIHELDRDPQIAAFGIAVAADDGKVTLRGTVGSLWQKREAHDAAERVHGVEAVTNELEVHLLAKDVKHSIEHSLDRNAKLDATALAVGTHDGTVTVSGVVSSWAEHDAAIASAWSAPGVTNVEDRIVVEY
jgi:osmotically-inducible protein OsmY